MKNILNGEVPLGLGMALAENADAMTAFAAMDERGRSAVIEGARSVRSKEEMRSYVARLAR